MKRKDCSFTCVPLKKNGSPELPLELPSELQLELTLALLLVLLLALVRLEPRRADY